jgi:23S rRNA (adenine2503-C2)-methyltransferase
MTTRHEQFTTRFPSEPKYRWKQVLTGLFSDARDWSEVTALPAGIRDEIKDVPWMSVESDQVLVSSNGETHKAILNVDGDQQIETVLMYNRRGAWSICISSQVGCAMRCGFCATGKMGLIRSLTADEIVDQYRFWKQYLVEIESEERISNIVFMGMGEPLANYENVREALNTILDYTDIGHTRIAVSTVGVLPRLEQILEDEEWPHVRLAISLHSAIEITRKQIVPTSYDEFLPRLKEWSKAYLAKFGNRRHHLTFEYVMLKEVNDTPEHAKALAKYVNSIGKVRVNLIPYNLTGVEYQCSAPATTQAFYDKLSDSGVVVTTRMSMGTDIEAACGQLINK